MSGRGGGREGGLHGITYENEDKEIIKKINNRVNNENGKYTILDYDYILFS